MVPAHIWEFIGGKIVTLLIYERQFVEQPSLLKTSFTDRTT